MQKKTIEPAAPSAGRCILDLSANPPPPLEESLARVKPLIPRMLRLLEEQTRRRRFSSAPPVARQRARNTRTRPREHRAKGGRGARAPDDPDPEPALEPAALAERACVFCGDVFEPKMPHQRRCAKRQCERARNAAKMAASRARRRATIEEIAAKAIEQLVDAGALDLLEALDLRERAPDVVAAEAARRHANGKPVPATIEAALGRAA